jgi:hypothetical protein
MKPGQKVLMMEDVVTTGLSSREAIDPIGEAGGEVIAAAAWSIARAARPQFDVPFFPLLRRSRCRAMRPTRCRPNWRRSRRSSRAAARRPERASCFPPLGVNIDHVATDPERARRAHPDPVRPR